MAGATRRDFIKALVAGVAGLALGGGLGYAAARGAGGDQAGAAAGQAPQARGLRALWIYVGPVTDYGWTRSHHDGKEGAASRLPWLESVYVESVAEREAYRVIKSRLDGEGYDAVFATSYGYMDAVKRLAAEYPEVRFYHCSGPWEEFRDLPNVTTYFAEFYQLYYLNGVAAGAVTETCRVGYVPAFLIPEVVRHVNAFALGAIRGARVAGKCDGGRRLEVYVTPPLKAWFAPDKARNAARTLVDQYDVDVIAYTEDTTAVLEAAESYWDEGMRVYSFSHYTDMYAYLRAQGRSARAHLTGQIADWAPIYTYLLSMQYSGAYEKRDVWARLGDFTPIRWRRPPGESRAGSPEGTVYLAPLNEQAIPASALEEIRRLYEDMKELLFEPFTGPLRGYAIDAEGRPQEEARLKVPEGARLGRDELWGMQWFHESITPLV